VANRHIDEVDDIDRDVPVIGTDFLPEHVLATHQHRHTQLLHGATCSMTQFLSRVNSSRGSGYA
jgi:hypothetical protein